MSIVENQKNLLQLKIYTEVLRRGNLYCLLLRDPGASNSSHLVGTGKKDTPVATQSVRGDIFSAPLALGGLSDLNVRLACPLQGIANVASNPSLSLFDISYEAAHIVLPLDQELGAIGVLATRHFHRDFHSVGKVVIEVLHPSSDFVPVGPIGDAVLEESPMLTDLGKVFENHRKKSHSTLRAKRATFTF